MRTRRLLRWLKADPLRDRQRDGVGQRDEDGGLRQADPQLALEAADDVPRFLVLAVGGHEQLFDAVGLPLLALVALGGGDLLEDLEHLDGGQALGRLGLEEPSQRLLGALGGLRHVAEVALRLVLRLDGGG